MKKQKYIKAPTAEEQARIDAGEKDVLASPLKKALDEDIGEIEEFSGDVTAVVPTRKKHTFKRRMYFSLGVFVSVMAVLGMILTVKWCVDLIKNIADNTSQKVMFEEYLLPIVICDPPVFDGTYTLTSDVTLMAAAWNIILYESDKYTDNFGYIEVPAIDIEASAAKLFGTNLSYVHQTLGDAELSFAYNEDTKIYSLPKDPHYLPYIPKVEEIERVGERYTLKVGYYSLMSAWMPNAKNETQTPDKYMEYTVTKRGNNYAVICIKELKIYTHDL